jgi:hypothetical protein
VVDVAGGLAQRENWRDSVAVDAPQRTRSTLCSNQSCSNCRHGRRHTTR